jgi:hypothetical protein
MVTVIVLKVKVKLGVNVTAPPVTCKVPAMEPEEAETRNDADVTV